jgi:hypothetical protein
LWRGERREKEKEGEVGAKPPFKTLHMLLHMEEGIV